MGMDSDRPASESRNFVHNYQNRREQSQKVLGNRVDQHRLEIGGS